jgi:hypothetical protein
MKKSNISDFFHSQTLSDITIHNKATGANYKYLNNLKQYYRCHKIVLASGCKYFLELFLNEDHTKLTVVRLIIL